MPRTRSQASPPPRRSGTERPRSVRGLTHRPPRSVKKTAPVKKVARKEPVEELQAIERVDQRVVSPAEAKLELIQRHAEARAERQHPSGFGALGIAIVVVICLVIFGVWWLLPDPFAKPKPVATAPTSITDTASTSTVQFVPASTTTSTDSVPTSTERRLLLPLTSTSSQPSS